jgi:hypothetical protein
VDAHFGFLGGLRSRSVFVEKTAARYDEVVRQALLVAVPPLFS